jgi:hypothetical protein
VGNRLPNEWFGLLHVRDILGSRRSQVNAQNGAQNGC